MALLYFASPSVSGHIWSEKQRVFLFAAAYKLLLTSDRALDSWFGNNGLLDSDGRELDRFSKKLCRREQRETILFPCSHFVGSDFLFLFSYYRQDYVQLAFSDTETLILQQESRVELNFENVFTCLQGNLKQ